MIAFKVAVTCSNCAQSFENIVFRRKVAIVCSHCGNEQGDVKPIKGFIYVAANSKQPGFAKVGLTSKDPEQRMKEISRGAGSIGNWTVAALFPSNRLEFDERRCHQKLARSREKNEVFAIDPAAAAVKVKTTLKRAPIEVSESFRAAYESRVEQNRSRAKHLKIGDTEPPSQTGLDLDAGPNEAQVQRGFLSGLFRS